VALLRQPILRLYSQEGRKKLTFPYADVILYSCGVLTETR
jgi:hypothetical protein